MRGAERTFAAIAERYDSAPIFTLLYDERGTNGRFAGHPLRTSPLQRLGLGQSNFRRLLPLYPWAIERLELGACDLVLSSSSAFAHGVRVPPGALHVCYCYTPFRYAWYEQQRALARDRPAAAPAAAPRAAPHTALGPRGQPPRRFLHRDLRAQPRAHHAATTSATRWSSTRPWRPSASGRASPASRC